ncbi:glycoside hydrolase family 28 protein [Rhodocaloribacter litoris]|uniref:glycoside hydrolase family 28 protein n=1 Tax=Rhodocaloribacter litoris TaxID=2558931 RepID=UPI00141DBBBC|nr:glycoside hydrolase family 28 protein [Rhodocaloribacter litoris]QXD14457.1 glycoside hydrolase family 28 protein [Rhodocaloribacter litoris]
MSSLASRREFLRCLAAGAGGLIVLPLAGSGCRGGAGLRDAAAWAEVPGILERIRPPRFPDRDVLVTDFGAVPGGTEPATDAFRRAVAACHDAGGGRVVVPPGDFLTGPIHLRSNVNLHLAEGATLRFSTNPEDYLPPVYTRWEGVELMNYSPLIYARGQENVAVTGAGTLDGQADEQHWWPWKGQARYGWTEGSPEQGPARDRLFRMAEDGVPVAERVFGTGDYLRPSFIEFYDCRNVLIEGVTIVRSPMWLVHPTLCTNVTVRGVTARSHGPNNDGCNPESCTDVLIEDCFFDTGDDCIALKSGRNADGRRVGRPIENVVIRRCTMRDGHGGIVIGSEMSGGARRIFAEACHLDSPNLDRVLRIKTNSVRGGFVEDVYLRDITAGQVADAVIRINFLYEEGDAGPHDPVVRNIDVRRLTSGQSTYALYLIGYPDAPIRDVYLADCRFDGVARDSVVEHVEGLVLDEVFINGERVERLAPTT